MATRHGPRRRKPRLAAGSTRPSRRDILLAGAGLGGAAVAGTLAACGGGSSSIPEQAGLQALIPAFPRSVPHIPVGAPMRLPFMIADTEGVPLAEIDGDVTFRIMFGDEMVDEVEVAPRSEGIPRAYLPLNHVFEEEGIYDLVATYQGSEMDAQVEVYPRDDVIVPFVGEQLPKAPTPTPSNGLEVDPMCTLVPTCDFHSVSLDDALDLGRPIALLVATPAYCQTAVCGPTLGNLIDIVEGRDDLVVIHAEVYQRPKEEEDLSTAALAPLPSAYQMTYEPALFVTDADGRITARADVMIDRSEMEELLA